LKKSRLIVVRFFKQPFYDIRVVKAANAHKQPFALMEVITLGITPLGTNFTGPILVITGEYHFIFCTGYSAVSSCPAQKRRFPIRKI
jgi:hypothetical protein